MILSSRSRAPQADSAHLISEWFLASFCNPRAEGSFDLVNLAELVIREGRNTVLRHQDLQFVEGIDTPWLCASFNKHGFGVLVPAEKKIFAQPLRMDLDPSHALGLQQGQECRFEFTQLALKIRRQQSVGANSQLIATCAEDKATLPSLGYNFQRRHMSVSPSGC